MPVQFDPRRNVYRFEPWPSECQVKLKPASEMSEREMLAEIAADREGEDALHRAYCVNAECPAKR